MPDSTSGSEGKIVIWWENRRAETVVRLGIRTPRPSRERKGSQKRGEENQKNSFGGNLLGDRKEHQQREERDQKTF